MCLKLGHNVTESWYSRLLAINFLRRDVNKYFRIWCRAAPPMVATAATGPPCEARAARTSARRCAGADGSPLRPPVAARTAGAPTEELLETGPVPTERPNFGGR